MYQAYIYFIKVTFKAFLPLYSNTWSWKIRTTPHVCAEPGELTGHPKHAIVASLYLILSL